MKIIKRTISIIVICALLVLAMEGFRFCVNDDRNSMTRITLHDFYEQKENIDILYVGSSHCYRSYIPDVSDEILGGHSFNLGTSAQRIDGSLALIKEAVKKNDISTIVLDIYFDMIETVPRSERTELTSTYAISDYMKPSTNWFTYLLRASSSDYYVNSFIVGRRSWDKLFDYYYVRDLVKDKLGEKYRNYSEDIDSFDGSYYVGRGYWANDSLLKDYVPEEGETGTIHIDVTGFNKQWSDTLKQIIEYCGSKDIKLVLAAAPMPISTFERIDNYSEYMEFINGQIKDTGIEYLDFNLLESGRVIASDEDNFMDDDHLNRVGADKYTRVFGKYLSDYGK